MTLQDLHNKKIGILGFGQEGRAVKEYLNTNGIEASVFDDLKTDNWPAEIGECNVLFRSPGIWRNDPEILKAEEKGCIVTSQVKWFFEHCPAKIIGVTGTKGKGTTCTFIHEVLQKNFPKVFLTGNIGKTQPLEFLDDLSADDWVIYELSSFQLQDLTQSPHIGVCLMVTSDHLNHHSNLFEYHSAKSAIAAFQSSYDELVFNMDYEASKKIGAQGEGNKYGVSAASLPDQGAFINGDNISINFGDKSFSLDCTSRKLKGAHNLENIAAGAMASLLAGATFESIQDTLGEFKGLEHRLQFVKEVAGVQYYNDSISTVPETVIAALRSFQEPIHLVLGGSDRGLDYQVLIEEFKNNPNKIAQVILVGEVGSQLKPQLAQIPSLKLAGPFTDFGDALREASTKAETGDIVLLSPGAASFDMFKSYADRGEQFINFVESL